jgi:menaquinone-dependent protoporphyrinogen oxidase
VYEEVQTMKGLILYGTKYGTTADCAAYLAEKWPGKVDRFQITGNLHINWADYTHVMVGGPVYIGRLKKEVVAFMKKYETELLARKLGLFICCMAQGQDAYQELEKNLPASLAAHASAQGCFGGAFRLSRMGWMDRAITKKAAKVTEDKEDIRYDEMDDFISKMTEDQKNTAADQGDGKDE